MWVLRPSPAQEHYLLYIYCLDVTIREKGKGRKVGIELILLAGRPGSGHCGQGPPLSQVEWSWPSWGLTLFNKTLCTSGPPAAPALFPLVPREEGGNEPRPRAGSLRLGPFRAIAITGHPHWPGCPSHQPWAPPTHIPDKACPALSPLAVGTGLEWGRPAPHGSGCCCCWGCCSPLLPPSGSSMCSSPRTPRPRLSSVTTLGPSSSVSPRQALDAPGQHGKPGPQTLAADSAKALLPLH